MNTQLIKRKLLSVFAMVFVLFTSNAQEVQNQTDQLKSLQLGNYRAAYLVDNEKGGYDYDLKAKTIILKEVNQDPNFNEHKYFILEENGTDYNYVINNYAFPATFGKEYFKGNKKLQEKVGYVPREFSQGRTVHIAVIEGMIYDFNWKFNPNDPKTFIPYRILVHESFLKEEVGADGKKKKKKLSLKQRMMRKLAGNNAEMKQTLLVNEKLRDVNTIEIAKNYITKALQKQNEMTAKWNQVAYNKQRVQMLNDRRKLMVKAMKKYNDDLMDTPEWRRIQENNRLGDAAAKANNVTIKNETGRDIYVYESGSLNGSRINTGSSGSYNCKKTYYYAFDGNSGTRGGNAGPKAYSANSSCGGTVSVK